MFRQFRPWIMSIALFVVILGAPQLVWSSDKDPGSSSPESGISDQANGIIETIANAFKGGEVAQEAQAELAEMAGNATYLLAMLFIGYLVASWLGRVIGNMVSKRVDLTLGKFLTKAVRNILLVVLAMIVLEQQYDINVTGFAAILAAAGFAVGMALQGTLGNFAAGVMLLVFRPFKVDDYIVVADTEGTVEEIDLFTTRLNSLDNRHVIVPNAEIFGAKLENYSRNPLRRVDVNVGAAYDADLDATRSALTAATHQVVASITSDAKIDAPTPQVYLMELGASSVDWQLRIWCHPVQYWDVREQLTAAAKCELDKAGIGIPFPQMDVHVVGKVLAKAA
ncbi:MAG: mechanosensitive ion channel family protein [Planctomycetota bacterium]